MNKNSGEANSNKNVAEHSNISAGKDMHIGDVNITIQPEKQKNLSNPLILIFFLFGAVGGGIFWQLKKPVNDAKVEKSAQKHLTTMADSSQMKRIPAPTISQHEYNARIPNTDSKPLRNNQVEGQAMFEGTGIEGIKIIASSGEFTSTDKNGHFKLLLQKEEQVQKIRLFMNDPKSRYEVVLPVLDVLVPKADIPINLRKKGNLY